MLFPDWHSERLLSDSAAADSEGLLNQLFNSFFGAGISPRILTPQNESKTGQGNPKTRRNPYQLSISRQFYSGARLLLCS